MVVVVVVVAVWGFFYIHECFSACMCAVPVEARRGELDPLKPELYIVISYTMWVLGTKLGTSARAICTLIH